MSNILKFGIIIIFTSIMFSACFKDTDEFFPYPPTNGTFLNIFNQFDNNSKILSYNLDDNAFFVDTENNARLHITGNVLDSANNIINGMIEIRIIEILKKGDMIRHVTPTISNDKLIASAGMYNIKLFKDGHELHLAQGSQIEIKIPLPNTTVVNENMRTFYGKVINNEIISSNNLDTVRYESVVWPQWNDSILNTTNWTTNNNTYFGYNLQSDSLNWINCDYFVETLPLTQCCVNLPDSFTNINTSMFMVFKDINSVTQLFGNSETKQFCIENMPVGQSVKLVSLSEINGRYYLGSFLTPITENLLIPMTPQPATIEEIQTFLDGL